jgi:hypothetical protein
MTFKSKSNMFFDPSKVESIIEHRPSGRRWVKQEIEKGSAQALRAES